MLEEIVERSEAQYELGGCLVKSNVKSLRNTEASKRKFARLRIYQHPVSPSASTIQVLTGPRDIDEMWHRLTEKRENPSMVQWEKVTDREESSQYMLEWCLRHFG